MNNLKVICPECKIAFEPTESLERIINEKVSEEAKKTKDKLEEQYDIKLDESRKDIKAQLKKEVSDKHAVTFKDMENQLKEMKCKDKNSQDTELNLRKQLRQKDEEIKGMDTKWEKETQSRVDKIEKVKFKNMQEEFDKKIKEEQEKSKLQKMEDDEKNKGLEAQIDELKRRINQGSQQTQGAAIEEHFENKLKAQFAIDKFSKVQTGVKGADLVQEVVNSSGDIAGSILWEFKNTKKFSQDWIDKLKENQQLLSGTVTAILVSKTLPKDTKPIEYTNGIFVVSYSIAIPFAVAIRKSIEDLSYARAATQGKGQKMELIYNYLTSSEFGNKVQRIIDVHKRLKDELDKEKKAYNRMWSAREKLLEDVINSTASMYGNIQGIAGKSTPQIEGLSLPEPESEIPIQRKITSKYNENKPPILN